MLFAPRLLAIVAARGLRLRSIVLTYQGVGLSSGAAATEQLGLAITVAWEEPAAWNREFSGFKEKIEVWYGKVVLQGQAAGDAKLSRSCHQTAT